MTPTAALSSHPLNPINAHLKNGEIEALSLLKGPRTDRTLFMSSRLPCDRGQRDRVFWLGGSEEKPRFRGEQN